MTNRSKAKGTAWETAIVAYLRENGAPYAERLAQQGALDRGDITGIPGIVIEAKSCKTMALAEWVDELTTEMRNANTTIGAVIHKRRGKNTANAYATLPFDVFCELLRDAGYLAP